LKEKERNHDKEYNLICFGISRRFGSGWSGGKLVKLLCLRKIMNNGGKTNGESEIGRRVASGLCCSQIGGSQLVSEPSASR